MRGRSCTAVGRPTLYPLSMFENPVKHRTQRMDQKQWKSKSQKKLYLFNLFIRSILTECKLLKNKNVYDTQKLLSHIFKYIFFLQAHKYYDVFWCFMKCIDHRHSKSRYFLRGQNCSFEILRKKKLKNIYKNQSICVKKKLNKVKLHKFSIYACKSQYFAQSQKIFARSHDRETVTIRNSALPYPSLKSNYQPQTKGKKCMLGFLIC